MRIALLPTPALRSEWGSTLHGVLLAESLAAREDVHVYCQTLPTLSSRRAHYHDLPLPLAHPVLVDAGVSDVQFNDCIHALVDAVVRDHSERPFDVIHAHYASFTALAALTASTVTGAPFVVSSFGRDLNVGAERDGRYHRMALLTLSQAHAVIASNDDTAHDLATRFSVPPRRIVTIAMGVDHHLFSPRARKPELRAALLGGAEHLLVNVASCFGVEKGIEVLMTAVQRLARRGFSLSLAIIGEDDYPDRREEMRLRRYADDLGLAREIAFLGRVPHHDIPDYLAAADLLVDSRLVGSFSSAVLEALFMRVPAVIPAFPSNETWFADGEVGLRHLSGDAGDLAEKVARTLSDAELRRTIAAALPGWASRQGARFNADHMRDQTIDLYHLVIEQAAGELAQRSRRALK